MTVFYLQFFKRSLISTTFCILNTSDSHPRNLSDTYCKVRGSYRRSAHLPGSRLVDTIDSSEHIEITVSVCPQNLSELQARVYNISNILPNERQYLTKDELEYMHSASQQDLDQIKSFAQSHGLEVVDVDASKRAVVLSGTVASLSSAFRAKLKRYTYNGLTYFGRTGWIHVPKYIARIVQGVHGLDNRPQFRRNFCQSVASNKKNKGIKSQTHRPCLTPLNIAKKYNFPTKDVKGTGLDGSGQCIALIELGGGFNPDEVNAYFQKIGITMPPQISSIPVGHGKNNPGVDFDADGEVMMDIAVAGAIAPGAKLAVYFSEETTKGFFDAVTQAVYDSQHNPSIISISWGGPEGSYWGQLMYAMNQSFLDAAALGRTICCASGDHGSSDLRPNNKTISDSLAHVEFPASSPFVLACGGTKLISPDAGITSSEIAWNDGKDGATGGGVSKYFSRPNYQMGISIPRSVNKRRINGRGVPDVAGIASPGYNIPVHGQEDPRGRGGTSAVAPLWAGLVALINQSIDKPIGFINPLLYKHPSFIGVLSDITKGNNSVRNVKVVGMGKKNVKGYKAREGWDACTGLGVPNGVKLLNAIKGNSI